MKKDKKDLENRKEYRTLELIITTKNKKMKINPISHTDVQGKVMLYLKVENSLGENIYINIGQKTFNGVAELLSKEPKPQELTPIEQPESAKEQATRMETAKTANTGGTVKKTT